MANKLRAAMLNKSKDKCILRYEVLDEPDYTQSGPTQTTSPTGPTPRTDRYESATSPGPRLPEELEAARPSTVGEEELQLQLALAMSKEEHDEEERKRRGDDVKLQLAIEESKKESEDTLRRHHQTSPSPNATLQVTSASPYAIPQPTQSKSRHRAQQNQTTLLDLAAGGVPPSGADELSDPWGSPFSTQAPNATPAADPWAPKQANDPWSSPSHPATASANPDPWTSGSPQSPPQPQPVPTPVTNDPWTAQQGAPAAPPPVAVSQSSAWPSPPLATTNGNGHLGYNANPSIDDAFDMLSARTASPTNIGATNSQTSSLGNAGYQVPYDMSNLNTALGGDSRKKTAEAFLGANANLVNLDNLITASPNTNGTSASPDIFMMTKPQDGVKPTSTNPFAATRPGAGLGAGLGAGVGTGMGTGVGAGQAAPASGPPAMNPFGPQTASAAARIPMNQMQTSSSMGFTDAASQQTILPQPLMPMSGSVPAMHTGGAAAATGSSNPFL